jgi:hypothetical protein
MSQCNRVHWDIISNALAQHWSCCSYACQSLTVIRFYAFHINGRQLRQFTYKVTCVARSRDVYTSSAVLTARFYGALTSPVNNKTCMYAKCPMFMPDFNQLWISSINFHKSSQYQISWVYVLWEPCWYMRTDIMKLVKCSSRVRRRD